jgi:alkanesulfonate monooxygenase SsuD/methylene tetrahydromethanopterin reductase-like flavin-dependent oxidoreductase (luciferase family)
MPSFTLHYDFRAPEFASSAAEVYAAALEQCAWADGVGFERVVISSHHGCDDDYGPAPLIAATAIAARTRSMRLRPVVTLPLYHPLHVAEEVAVLDLISGGRAELLLAAGYRPAEFAMFGHTMAERGALMEEGVQALRKAWTGEPFDFRGERVLVRPRPLQRPEPPIAIGGYSRAAARRAARLGVSFAPMPLSGAEEHYAQACAEFGRRPPTPARPARWMFLHVTEDPDAAWHQLAPHLLHVNNSYARWMAEAGTSPVYSGADSVDELRGNWAFQIVTPDECIALARDVDAVMVDPLFGGLPPALAWESLELIAKRVIPAFRPVRDIGAGEQPRMS